MDFFEIVSGAGEVRELFELLVEAKVLPVQILVGTDLVGFLELEENRDQVLLGFVFETLGINSPQGHRQRFLLRRFALGLCHHPYFSSLAEKHPYGIHIFSN